MSQWNLYRCITLVMLSVLFVLGHVCEVGGEEGGCVCLACRGLHEENKHIFVGCL